MNDLVKNSIESRKIAIYNSYNITDKSIIDKMEDLFKRINEFGEDCVDNIEFENKFATSELNQEYIQLFTEIATQCTPINIQNEENRQVKSDEEYILEEVASEALYQARNATEPIRRQIHQEAYDEVRDMPIIGDILNVKQHVGFFSRFKRNKKNNKDEEENSNNSKRS